ncbi:uncharacterized protein G2W53_032669 [Senna tora]|uniref:Uncharacterized protein n=1 Tax=Senna tora TaxID=362788 RepID=A0A834SXX6_9FABA|nr:uncharacterized protein G2W53_032669 [Senna tora]
MTSLQIPKGTYKLCPHLPSNSNPIYLPNSRSYGEKPYFSLCFSLVIDRSLRERELP